jgi:F-type H+-transporting ATPase subunit gamma
VAGGTERTLRRRIRTVQSTKKITRAFELIAASQIVRAQGRIAANRPFRDGMARIVLEAAEGDPGAEQLIGTPEDPKHVAIVVLVGDRGLSGPYNSSVLRATEAHVAAHQRRGAEVQLVTVGRKAVAYFRFRGRDLTGSFTGMSDRPTFADARRVAAELWHRFDADEVDLVQLVSTRYLSAGRQAVATHQLLPLPDPTGRFKASPGDTASPGDAGGSGDTGGAGDAGSAKATAATDSSSRGGYTEFEPDVETLLAHLMPRALESEIFAALLEASASEHASRQRAMAAATENADELVQTLTRTMNRARQDAITTEIMEIVGGAEALRPAKGA